jgi:hypothetical protein
LEDTLLDYASGWHWQITEEPTAADTERASAFDEKEEARGQMPTVADSELALGHAPAPRPHEGRYRRHDTGESSEYSNADRVPEPFDFESFVRRASRKFVERIERKLVDDREEADDVAPTPAAVQTCSDLARRLAPHVVLAPQLKSGAFTEDNGGISLVLQSLVTDRRLDVRIAPEGTVLSAIRIDERLQADSIALSVNDPNAPKELAEWVTSRV